MTKQMIRIDAGPPQDITFEEIQQSVSDWVDKHATWSETADMVLSRHQDIDGVWGHWWFESSEDQSILLDETEVEISSHCDWYLIRYHVCDHDEGENTPCSWDESSERSAGSIPEGI